MNEKDKEAFEKWLNGQDYKYDTWDGQDYRDGKVVSIYSETEEAWQAACEYKEKEIDLIQYQLDYAAKIIIEVQADKCKIREENKKLREALESIAFYDEPDADKESYWQNINPNKLPPTMATDTFIAREALKEVGEK